MDSGDRDVGMKKDTDTGLAAGLSAHIVVLPLPDVVIDSISAHDLSTANTTTFSRVPLPPVWEHIHTLAELEDFDVAVTMSLHYRLHVIIDVNNSAPGLDFAGVPSTTTFNLAFITPAASTLVGVVGC